MKRGVAFGLVAAAASFLAACGGESDSVQSESVSIRFSASVGAETLACGEASTLVGTANSGNGSLPDIKDFRVYVSDVQVATADGDFVPLELDQNDWQYQNVALLDFEEGRSSCNASTEATNRQITGMAPAADYSRVRFTLGVPENLNHLDSNTAESPLNLTGLHWNWAGGYKHARMDVTDWNIHLGTTGCDLNDNNLETLDCSGARNNRPTYTFEAVDLDESTLNFDYAALVADSDISTDQGGAPGCMSGATDPECAAVFHHLGLNVETGDCADGGCDTQDWVSVE